MDKREPGWVYIALDVESSHFGDALSELGRTGWKITGAEELPATDQQTDAPGVWHRLYAKKQIHFFVQGRGP